MFGLLLTLAALSSVAANKHQNKLSDNAHSVAIPIPIASGTEKAHAILSWVSAFGFFEFRHAKNSLTITPTEPQMAKICGADTAKLIAWFPQLVNGI
ncbi:MAG: hypothetical protein CMO80_14140 [Verrucomicrobiales bacterium]|nr:hypothetical protein [Verrucomicrobiales bacterium]